MSFRGALGDMELAVQNLGRARANILVSGTAEYRVRVAYEAAHEALRLVREAAEAEARAVKAAKP